MTEPLQFKVSSALKSVIGRDLITNDFVAIFELVKNSFDANATRVDIVFNTDKDNKDRIYIIDNGKGMSYDDLVDKWLFLAYSAKKDGSEDVDDNRIYAGNKGVGRFSCDRLGGVLRIQAKTEDSQIINILDVDWEDFEKNDKNRFEDILVFHNISDNFSLPTGVSNIKTGVVVEISNLRDSSSWDRNKLLKLKRHLAKLINPFGDEDSKIEVVLHSHNQLHDDMQEKKKSKSSDKLPQLVNGPVKNFIFDTLKQKTTWLHVYIRPDGWIYSDLIDRSELIYRIKENAKEYPDLINSDFSCQIFYLNQSAKVTFNKQMGLPSVQFGSLFLFRNGFRVFPVGEPGDDYWTLDRRKSQGYARYLGTREILGRIDIAGSENKFKESSSRDKGLIETAASKQLFDCVVEKCVKRLESYVVGVSWKDKLDKVHETAKRLSLDENRNNIISLISSLSKSKNLELLEYNNNLVDVLSEKSKYFENSIENLVLLAEKTNNKELVKDIYIAKERFEEEKKAKEHAIAQANEEAEARKKAEENADKERKGKEKAESERDKYSDAYKQEQKRNLYLVSSGSRDKEQLESFMHQIIIYAVESKDSIEDAIIELNNDKYDADMIKTFFGELLENTRKIITTSRFATSANFTLDSEQVEGDICQHIEQYIDNICTAYNSRININVTNNAPEFIIRFTPIELGMVLDNLVQNAKKARADEIDFILSSTSNDVLEINIIDTGKGLNKSILEKDRIFEKGFTTTDGSGLGLYHSRKQIEEMGGELMLTEVQPKRGTHFIMRFKKQ